MAQTDRPLPVLSSDELGVAVTRRDDAALWGSIVLLHLWGAVGYIKPGWLPAVAGVAQLILLLAVYYSRLLSGRATPGDLEQA